MTTPELPPLYHVWRARSSVAVTKESVEARERILMARIADLQEDADRRTREVEATYHVQARLNARIADLVEALEASTEIMARMYGPQAESLPPVVRNRKAIDAARGETP